MHVTTRTRTLLVLSLLAFGIPLTPGPAHATDDACATRGEYRHVKKGMTYEKVEEVFGGTSSQTFVQDDGVEIDVWNACEGEHQAVVKFKGPQNKAFAKKWY